MVTYYLDSVGGVFDSVHACVVTSLKLSGKIIVLPSSGGHVRRVRLKGEIVFRIRHSPAQYFRLSPVTDEHVTRYVVRLVTFRSPGATMQSTSVTDDHTRTL